MNGTDDQKSFDLVFDRASGRVIEEPIYGVNFFRWCYTTRIGKLCLEHLFSNKPINHLYGAYMRSARSRRKIFEDEKKFGISLDDFEEKDYRNYEEFFLRRFKSGKRIFGSSNEVIYSSADANLLAYPSLKQDRKLTLKGQEVSVRELLKDPEWSAPFIEGPVIVLRLTPVDYHWYHYPTSGHTLKTYTIPGKLYSVSQYALQHEPKTFLKNERRVSILQTKALGKLAVVEIGALCVGKIVQTHDERTEFKIGSEKGYFSYGASTVVIIGEKGAWEPALDLVEKTLESMETRVKLGERISRS